MSRRLTQHERELWLKVARTVRPMPGRMHADIVDAVQPATVTDEQSKSGGPSKKRETPRTAEPRGARSAPAPQVADMSGHRKVRRGQTPIDARIDLHGFTQDGAYRELVAFVHREHAHGARCLLVITGKGRSGGGVLRSRFLDWIAGPDLRGVIAGYAPSHQRHGGGGAFYLMLKARRLEQ